MSNDYRPRLTATIKEDLEQDINGNSLFKEAGFSSKVSFIDQAIKEKIEREKQRLENEIDDRENESSSQFYTNE